MILLITSSFGISLFSRKVFSWAVFSCRSFTWIYFQKPRSQNFHIWTAFIIYLVRKPSSENILKSENQILELHSREHLLAIWLNNEPNIHWGDSKFVLQNYKKKNILYDILNGIFPYCQPRIYLKQIIHLKQTVKFQTNYRFSLRTTHYLAIWQAKHN